MNNEQHNYTHLYEIAEEISQAHPDEVIAILERKFAPLLSACDKVCEQLGSAEMLDCLHDLVYQLARFDIRLDG